MYEFSLKMCLMVVGMDWSVMELDGEGMEVFKMVEIVLGGLKYSFEEEWEGKSSKWIFWELYWNWRSASGQHAASRVLSAGQPRVAVSFPESNSKIFVNRGQLRV